MRDALKILCWNTDDAIWEHWNKVIEEGASLIRTRTLDEVMTTLKSSEEGFNYLFVFLENSIFSEKVENVVSLSQDFPDQKIVVFPNQPSQTAALRLFTMGVNGQCSPYIGKPQLALALSVIDSGEIWGGKDFIQNLIAQSAPSNTSNKDNSKQALLGTLSEREIDVAQLVASGLSNKQIANQMDITERTVKAHLTAIFKKTHTRDRLSLAILVQNSVLMH